MGALKKTKITPGESNMEAETKRFNKRAFIGSFIIHLFFFLIKLPHLEMVHKLKDDPKLIPIKMELVTPPSKSNMVKNTVKAAESEVVKTPPVEEKVKNGTDREIKNSDRLGDKNQKKVQDVQKGDPASKKREAYKPGTEVRKTPRTSVGSGSAASQVKAKDNNTGGSGDTYQGIDMTNVTDSIRKSGQGLKRVGAKGAKDDGGAGFGTGGGIGNGVGGGGGDGFITGSPNGTANIAKVATNIGSLTGSAKGTIDSSRGFDGLAQKGSVMVAGVPVEKVQLSGIDPNAIRQILRDNIGLFRHCYQKELDVINKADFQGQMTLKFFIVQGGRVDRPSVISPDIPNDEVRNCMVKVLTDIKFPSPRAGRVEVSQPMYLYPKRM